MNTIKDFREKAGLSQEAVAVSLGVAQSAVSQWERGVTAPRCHRLRGLAQLFRCSIDDLAQDAIQPYRGVNDGRFSHKPNHKLLPQKQDRTLAIGEKPAKEGE